MNEQIRRSLTTVKDFKALGQLEKNVRKRVVFDDDVAAAFKERGEIIAREMIVRRTGLDLDELTPAEEKIVRAVSEYLSIKRREGSDAGRTLTQLRNRGLIESAEVAVSRSKPTQGFETLRDEDLDDLSYEQIIIDHPEEFSPRAIWYAKRTLEIPNASDKPPARHSIPVQIRTEELLSWLAARAAATGGEIPPFANLEAATALGMPDMTRHGRVYGNVQSRLDFACYRLGLPPLGLTATEPFPQAWRQEDRSWPFPLRSMQQAARSFCWQRQNFERLLTETRALAGQAHIIWKAELRDNQAAVRAWAEGLEDISCPNAVEDTAPTDEELTVAEEATDNLDRLAELERKFLNAGPEVQTRVSKGIERGPIGREVKRLNGFRCQICEALGRDPVGFSKKNGEPYVEAHHMMPVSRKEIGSLSAANIVTVCANHHRELHYGNASVTIENGIFSIGIDGRTVKIPRIRIVIDASLIVIEHDH